VASRWTGAAYLTERFLAYAGPLGPTDLHSHHAVQVALGLEGPVCLRDSEGRAEQGEAAVVPRDVAHAIVEPTKHALLLYVNPESTPGRRIAALAIGAKTRSWFEAGAPLRRLQRSISLATSEALQQAAQDITRDLVGEAPRPTSVHPAVRRLLSSLPSHLDGDVRLPALADSVGLSAGRLGHLFTETVGIPLRPYVLWLRLQRAAVQIQGGASLTIAAHAAGFADSSHLSNTFRRMFGLSPSEVAEHVRWLLPPASPSE
jgi:AraC-like DNA-binding protein